MLLSLPHTYVGLEHPKYVKISIHFLVLCKQNVKNVPHRLLNIIPYFNYKRLSCNATIINMSKSDPRSIIIYLIYWDVGELK